MGIYNSLLDDLVDRKVRKTPTSNAWGEPIYSWEIVDTKIRCKIFNISHEEFKNKEGEWEDIKYKIYFHNSQELHVEDRIIYNSKEYEIVELFEDCEQKFKRALVKEL